MEKVYASKVDIWFAAILLITMALCSMLLINAVRTGDTDAFIAGLPGAIIGFGVPFWLFATTRYTLNDSNLLVKSGPFKWNIPVKEISAITPTSNPLSSPAMSLDRLRIDYGHYQSVMISPKHKAEFIKDLEERREKSRQV